VLNLSASSADALGVMTCKPSAARQTASPGSALPVLVAGENAYDISVFGRELSLKLFRNSVEGVCNPALVDEHSDELCEAAYAAHHAFMKRFVGDHPLLAARSELRGYNLSCYCDPDDACHSSILLEISNKP